MDFKVIGETKQILLERIEADDQAGGWQVVISVYRSLEDRYDEWVSFPDPQAARSFIHGFSWPAAQQFLTRAEAKTKAAKSHA